MTTILETPTLSPAPTPSPPPRHHPGSRVRAWIAVHRASLAWLTPVLVLGAVTNVWGLGNAPQRVDDEGTYVAQAYAVQHFGQLAHYTYWYDHPPLGWLQLAVWTSLTDGFARVHHAVDVGRQAMVISALVSAVLLWLLARRSGLSRPAAAAAAALFLLSPLAVAYHRMVYLDNIATPWMLAAFLLGAPRRHELGRFIGAAICFAVAVLTKETYALLFPALVWWMWRHSTAATRRYTLTVAGSLLGALLFGYVVFAVLRGELLPGPHHVSLVQGIEFQLVERRGSGNVLNPASQAGATVGLWLQWDWVLPLLATVCAVGLLAVRRFRPLAFAYVLQLVLLLRPGYLPVPYLVAMLPFGALAVAAVVDLGMRWRPAARVATGLACVAAIAIAAPVWAQGLTTLTTRDLDRPLAQSEQWVIDHAGRHDRLLVDDATWVDLVRAGFQRSRVVWYYKADTDPAVMRLTPDGWHDYDYVLVTESMRRSLQTGGTAPGGGVYPVLANSFRHSHVVASYGSGNQRVEVRRVSDEVPGVSFARSAPSRSHRRHGHPAPPAARPAAAPSSSSVDSGAAGSGGSTGARETSAPVRPKHHRHARHGKRGGHRHAPAPPSTSPSPAQPSPSGGRGNWLSQVLQSLL